MIVQERKFTHALRMPAFDHGIIEEQVFFDLCPLVFNGRMGGVMVRFSSSPLTNVSAGGCVSSLWIVDGWRESREARDV